MKWVSTMLIASGKSRTCSTSTPTDRSRATARSPNLRVGQVELQSGKTRQETWLAVNAGLGAFSVAGSSSEQRARNNRRSTSAWTSDCGDGGGRSASIGAAPRRGAVPRRPRTVRSRDAKAYRTSECPRPIPSSARRSAADQIVAAVLVRLASVVVLRQSDLRSATCTSWANDSARAGLPTPKDAAAARDHPSDPHHRRR